MFGFSEVLTEVTAVAFKAFRMSEGAAVGDLVRGAGVFFEVVKAFSENGLEAAVGFELTAEGAQGKGGALAGEVGMFGAVDDVEAAELDDELEAIRR